MRHPSPLAGLHTLVTLASTGDANAFGELVVRFGEMAVAYARTMLGDAHLAEDAAQEAFVAAWKTLPQLREPGRFPGWLRSIVATHCHRQLRRRRVPTIPIGAASEPAENRAPADVRQMLLARCIADLPEHERQVMVLFYYAGEPIEVIGRFLDLPDNTVKSRLFKGRRRLKQQVNDMVGKDLDAVPTGRDTQFLEKVMRMIKPETLKTEQPHGPWNCRGRDIWDMICAAITGDVEAVRRLLKKDANLYRCEYWYTQPIHFAVREGHLEVVRALLEAGADPTWRRLGGEDLVTVARDRGHEDVAGLLESEREKHTRAMPQDHEIHTLAAAGDWEGVRRLVEADASLVLRGDRQGRTPLHLTVPTGRLDVVGYLLDHGAEIDATQASGDVYVRSGARPIEGAIELHWKPKANWLMVGYLLGRGAAYTVAIAAAAGDLHRVRALLDKDPPRIEEQEPSGRRPLSCAAAFGRMDVVKLLLERGADPNWPEDRNAPRGTALHAAARTGNSELVELLLAHGADPNQEIDSSGNAAYAASTKEIRALILAAGGELEAFTLAWMDEDDELLRRAAADPAWAATSGCGGAFAAVCSKGKRDTLDRLLDLGVRVAPVVTGCRSYLWTHPDMLRTLLERGGMNPNLPNWQRVTPLHEVCGQGIGGGRPHPAGAEVAAILLDHGADINAKDEEYRSTPLGWAARNDRPDMVELLLSRDAATNLPDDEPWATPLAWAARRGHQEIVQILRRHGAKA